MHSPALNQRGGNGWRGISLIAITYIYFLIFAQFGFLKRLTGAGLGGDELKAVMGAMAFGGILVSLLAPRLENRGRPARRLQAALAGCAAGALLTLLPLNLVGGVAIAALIGAALGLLTVTLVTHLNLWVGANHPLFKIGCGVGLAYFICNYPPLFEAEPSCMALVSAALCVVGLMVAEVKTSGPEPSVAKISVANSAPPFLLALGCFTALVWLDSAAFFIIQNTPALKSGTWEGARRLWQNGGVHFLAALASAGLLRRHGLTVTLALAFAFLGCACLLLHSPAGAALASVAYPIGVSLYSVALVAYPAYLANAVLAGQRARFAGWLYAVAGWLGSGLGIGMGQNLRQIPPWFVLAAALLFFAPGWWRNLQRRRREWLTLACLFGGTWAVCQMIAAASKPAAGDMSLVEKGRQVYIAEGCIHCHSQYVRPTVADETMWGPPTDVDASRAEQPPLIGNRRQGPDLASVGNRRSPLWLKAHFISPEALTPHSPMPSYAHLFKDERGDALVAYLQSRGAGSLTGRLERQSAWQATAVPGSVPVDGAGLVNRYCLTCHAATGATRLAWGSRFKRLPPDFAAGPFAYAPVAADVKWRLQRLAEIIKFGLPGTDMPGHEYLSDAEVTAMAAEIVRREGPKQP